TSWKCLRRPAPLANSLAGPEQSQGYLDAPVENDLVHGGGRLRVAGWTFSTRGIDRLTIAVDGVLVGETRAVGTAREDVAAVFRGLGDTALYSGFEITVP